MKFFKVLGYSLIVGLFGCAVAGIPQTSDPAEKIAYAYQLKNNGRPVPAQDLLIEALGIYEAEKDKSGMAATYLAFGNLYKSDSYHKMADVFTRWNEYKSYEDAASYFIKASSLYLENDNYLMSGLAKVGAGDSYYINGQIKEACLSYSEAEVLSEKSVGDKQSLLTRINAFRENVSCD